MTTHARTPVIVGDDGQWLLDRLEQEDAEHLRELRTVATLRAVWAIHYIRGEDGHMRWTVDGERGSSETIETPHDPDARWATKRSTDWIGYKLQVTETNDADFPHLITDIAITPALESDMLALDAIRERQQALDALPSERYVDSGYVSGGNAIASENLGEDLIGPIRDTSTPQSRMPDGFTHDDFHIDSCTGDIPHLATGIIVAVSLERHFANLEAQSRRAGAKLQRTNTIVRR